MQLQRYNWRGDRQPGELPRHLWRGDETLDPGGCGGRAFAQPRCAQSVCDYRQRGALAGQLHRRVLEQIPAWSAQWPTVLRGGLTGSDLQPLPGRFSFLRQQQRLSLGGVFPERRNRQRNDLNQQLDGRLAPFGRGGEWRFDDAVHRWGAKRYRRQYGQRRRFGVRLAHSGQFVRRPEQPSLPHADRRVHGVQPGLEREPGEPDLRQPEKPEKL